MFGWVVVGVMRVDASAEGRRLLVIIVRMTVINDRTLSQPGCRGKCVARAIAIYK